MSLPKQSCHKEKPAGQHTHPAGAISTRAFSWHGSQNYTPWLTVRVTLSHQYTGLTLRICA